MKRVWIYQSSRLLQQEEIEQSSQILQEFVRQWTAHGNQLTGSFEIRYGLFIILQVDEEKAMVTGCSIDKSVHLLKDIETALGISLFDRLQIAYRDQAGAIQVVSQADFGTLLSQDKVDEHTIVFNNSITSADDLEDRWEVPVKDSWHARVFL